MKTFITVFELTDSEGTFIYEVCSDDEQSAIETIKIYGGALAENLIDMYEV